MFPSHDPGPFFDELARPTGATLPDYFSEVDADDGSEPTLAELITNFNNADTDAGNIDAAPTSVFDHRTHFGVTTTNLNSYILHVENTAAGSFLPSVDGNKIVAPQGAGGATNDTDWLQSAMNRTMDRVYVDTMGLQPFEF